MSIDYFCFLPKIQLIPLNVSVSGVSMSMSLFLFSVHVSWPRFRFHGQKWVLPRIWGDNVSGAYNHSWRPDRTLATRALNTMCTNNSESATVELVHWRQQLLVVGELGLAGWDSHQWDSVPLPPTEIATSGTRSTPSSSRPPPFIPSTIFQLVDIG